MIEERFQKRLWARPFSYAAEINDDGLVFGAGTILARIARDPFGLPILALEEDSDRVLALLAAAYSEPVSSDVLRHLEGASGEKALANIRLAFARLPRLEDRVDAWRLFLAEALLDDGMAPAALMEALGFDSPLAKYDPNELHVPAGHGIESGRWTKAGTGAETTAPATGAIAAGGGNAS